MPIRLWLYLGSAIALAALGWAVHHRIDSGGYERCQDEHKVAAAEAATKAHEDYLGAVSWGNQISAQLAERQRQIQTLRTDHATYALSLDGTCPGRLRYLHDAAALGTALPDPTRIPLTAAQPIDAARIGGAVAENYARARDCQAQLNALIDWHEGHP